MHRSYTSTSDRPQTTDQGGWRRFTAWFIGLATAAMVLLTAANVFLLWRAGEVMPQPDMVEYQKRHGGLYRSGSSDDIMAPWLRLERYEHIQPEIVALGSSRVLQFRQEHFARPFANLGMSLDWAYLPNVARALVERPHRLKLVILSVDFWQVNDAVPHGREDETWTPRREFTLNPRLLKVDASELQGRVQQGPLMLLFAGRLTLGEVATILCRCDAFGPNKNLGVAALSDGSGIDAAGSYHYTWVFDQPAKPSGFAGVLDRVRRGVEGFQYADAVDPVRWGHVVKARRILEDAGVRVVVILPPVAAEVAQAMTDAGRYGIVADLSRHLKETGAPFHDFHDPRRFGSDDCEFADGFHGGEVTYLRMLDIMARDPSTGLAEYVNLPEIQDRIARFSGHVLAYDIPRSGDKSRREKDFLGLGCRK